ncbi:uncharacterized protein LOC125674267 isoform X2 [Ostrea edulis]|uniref:uncharacterized protein LOC125674267 isoform X2 n=1 Tax=Ostrea edulis TaxID=37623 RepID=UPI0024AFB941|nr:uncharacterized protein LOC125674267 isoform X2 [Ostrea edulis]
MHTVFPYCIDPTCSSLGKVKFVEKCPTDAEAWKKAAARLNCGSVSQSCSQSMGENAQYFVFQYHCVINAWRNATLEVCAPNRTILGFCAEFNFQGAMIQDNYDADCTKHETPCPTSYDSAEAYKYPSCYEMVRKNRQRAREDILKPISLSNRITGNLVHLLSAVLSVIFLRTITDYTWSVVP